MEISKCGILTYPSNAAVGVSKPVTGLASDILGASPDSTTPYFRFVEVVNEGPAWMWLSVGADAVVGKGILLKNGWGWQSATGIIARVSAITAGGNSSAYVLPYNSV